VGVTAIYLKEVVSSTNAEERSSIFEWLRRGLTRDVLLKEAGDQSEIVDCPIDGTKLRIPSGKARIKVLCPRCGYRFLVSTLNQDKRRSLHFFS
jgi:DNA-directed RNA polymerase subunit RPC12/RpoP